MKCSCALLLSTISLFSIVCQLSATVLVTHGMGTGAIQFYKDSGYIQELAASAQALDHTVKSVAWLSPDDPNKEYAGLHPQERIAGAVAIARAIIDEAAAGQKVILVGHSFGGQVMQCATRLLNQKNKEITDTFVYELVYTIKDLLTENKGRSPLYPPKSIINGLMVGWHISKVVIAAIEKANIINQHLIDYVKQHLSLDYIQEIKNTWAAAFDAVQTYKKTKNLSGNGSVILYTIGTPFNSSDIFTADMAVVTHHINLYSVEDAMPAMVGSPCAPSHPRTANLRVYLDPHKGYAPGHQEFCGNLLMAPWILLIPGKLQEQRVGNFDRFVWGGSGSVTFFAHQAPVYQPD